MFTLFDLFNTNMNFHKIYFYLFFRFFLSRFSFGDFEIKTYRIPWIQVIRRMPVCLDWRNVILSLWNSVGRPRLEKKTPTIWNLFVGFEPNGP